MNNIKYWNGVSLEYKTIVEMHHKNINITVSQ